MKTKIKLCGIKREDEIHIINKFPLTYAGFIFAKSKRQVDIKTCLYLKKQLRNDIIPVGVFVDEPLESLLETVKRCKLKVVQLHGSESVDYIQKIPVNVWKTIPVKDESSLEEVKTYEHVVEAIVFETYHEQLKGGTGKTFDWSLLKEYLENRQQIKMPMGCQIVLAGGISPENAVEARKQINPDVLDVNSGVEVDGFKKLDKIEKLFKELK